MYFIYFMRINCVVVFTIFFFLVKNGLEGNMEIKNSYLIYVSKDGSDSFSGRLSRRFKNDGPFLTIQRAIDEIKNIKQKNKGTLKKPVVIMIRGGTYFQKSQLR